MMWGANSGILRLPARGDDDDIADLLRGHGGFAGAADDDDVDARPLRGSRQCLLLLLSLQFGLDT